jgi:hypothetical protein
MKRSAIITGTIFLILVAAVFVFWSQFYKLKPLQHCSPWRTITGYSVLCIELNKVSNCAKLNCNGTTVQKVYDYLTDANNADYFFSSTQSFSIIVQNQMISRANTWAYANAPANYSVEFIEFVPAIATPTAVTTYAKIEIKVTYKICNGSNSPGK